MKRNFLVFLFVFGIFMFIALASAVDFTPQGNINLRGVYNLTNLNYFDAFTMMGNIVMDNYNITNLNYFSGFSALGNIIMGNYNLTGADYVDANYFTGDGSLLTGLAGGGDINAVNTPGSYLYGGAESGAVNLYLNGTELNNSIDARDSDTTYTAGSNISLVGTEFAVNTTSLKDWWDTIYQAIGNYLTTATNFGGELSGNSSNIILNDDALDDQYVNIEGDNMTGDLNMSFNNIYGINYSYMEVILSATGNSINIQPDGDADDFFSFKTLANRPTIKREGGKFIYFESSNVYDMGISLRKDDTYSGTLNYEKDNNMMTLLGKNSPVGIKTNSEYVNYFLFETYNHQPQISVYNGTILKINDSLEVIGDGNFTGNVTAVYFCNSTDCYLIEQFLSDSDTTYTNGSAISLVGNQFNLTTCADNQIWKMNGAVWNCEVDDAGAGTYTWNLSGDSGTDQVIDTTNVVNITGGTNGIDTVVGAIDKITINLDWTEVASDAISEVKIDMDTVCAAGSHLYVNGNDFACETDDDTTYTNGSGISLVGIEFNHSDTSSQASEDNSGNTFIQDIILDTYGHITSIVNAAVDFSAYVAIVDLVGMVGNWSADKGDYSTTAEANALYRAESWDNFTGIPTATPSDGDTTHLSTADQIRDWVIGLAYSAFGASVDDTEMTAEDFGEFTCTGEEDGCTLDSGTFDDEYVELGDSFTNNGGDATVTGAYNAVVITIGHDALDDQYYDSEGDLTGLLDDNYEPISAHFDATTNNITCLNSPGCTWFTNATDSCIYWPSGGKDCGAA